MMKLKTGNPERLFLFCFFWSFCSVNIFYVASAQTNLFRGFKTGKEDGTGAIDDVPLTTTLSNGVVVPLAGLGVGNLQRNLVETSIHEALKDDHRIRLFDTSHAAGNEREVAKGITTGVKALKDERESLGEEFDRKKKIQVHVVTKIWYTHLGYQRTKLAVEEILENFEEAINDPNVDLKLTLLIHWPKCFDEIPWMKCKEEEDRLPERIKNAGPPPHLDDNAWKESWWALEDLYDAHNSVDNNKNDSSSSVIAAVGISNFDRASFETLLSFARIRPHVNQINVWGLLHNKWMIDLMNEANVHMQVFNVMDGMIRHVYENPKAHHHLLMIANRVHQKYIQDSVSVAAEENSGRTLEKVFLVQLMLKWFVQSGISVIPRTSKFKHLDQNSAVSLSMIPDLDDEQTEVVSRAMVALIENEDFEDDVLLQVRFHATVADMFLYWVPDEGDVEKQVAFIEKGSSYEESAHPGHVFKVYQAYDPDQVRTYSIGGHYGDTQDIHVEL